MSRPSPLSDEERADLVAYLDGELEGEAAQVIETRLSRDPTLRAEAEALQRTWDLLDYLPRTEPSPSFTQRTVSRISARETRAALRRGGRLRRWLRAAGWAAAVLLAGLAGYTAALYLYPTGPTEQDLVRDLRLIENLRFYEPVETIEFLRELDHPDLFGEDPLDS
jgi:anti-sigma factor RsiW